MAFAHELFARVVEVVIIEHHCVSLKDSGGVLVSGLHLFVVECVLFGLNFCYSLFITLDLCGCIAHKILVDLIDGGLIDLDFAYSDAVYDLDTFEGLHWAKSSPS